MQTLLGLHQCNIAMKKIYMITSQCKNYMQSEKARTDIHWNATGWATLEEPSAPRRQTCTTKQVLRNTTVEMICCRAALPNRSRDWTNIKVHSKMQLGPTRPRISSTTFPNFKLHIFDYHCSTMCQRTLWDWTYSKAHPWEQVPECQHCLAHTAPDLNHKPLQAGRHL